MKTFYLQSFFILFLLPSALFADPIDRVADLIRQGNIHELSKLFASSVEITMLDDENVYSKAQTELILNKFFSQNKPRTVKMLHKVNSNPNYMFGVLIANTDKGHYRITYTMQEIDGILLIIEMRIEVEKVK